jgi:Domain of unknown function (DUF222)
MDSNVHSVTPVEPLTALAAAADSLAAQDLDGQPDAVRAERVLVLRRLLDRLEGHWLHELDPPRLRRVVGHLQLVADPDGATSQTERRHQQRGLWLSSTLDGMVAIDGLLEAEAGQTLISALEPLARPADATDTRSSGQRRADALTELAGRNLEAGQLPQTGGVRPQLTITVDFASLVGNSGPGTLGATPAPDPWIPRPVGGWPVTAI